AYDYTGRAEDLDPADRAALLTPATDPEVIRCAQVILAAIHRDMDRTPAGLKPIPRDVGSFTRLQDYRDARQYLILLIPYDPDDCTCGRAGQGPRPTATVARPPATAAPGTAGRSSPARSRPRYPVCSPRRPRQSTPTGGRPQAQEEITGLRAAMLAAAEITDLPARFAVEQQPGQPRLIIRDQVSGRHTLVPLFAYGAVR